jgi:hypothetical protein
MNHSMLLSGSRGKAAGAGARNRCASYSPFFRGCAWWAYQQAAPGHPNARVDACRWCTARLPEASTAPRRAFGTALPTPIALRARASARSSLSVAVSAGVGAPAPPGPPGADLVLQGGPAAGPDGAQARRWLVPSLRLCPGGRGI